MEQVSGNHTPLWIILAKAAELLGTDPKRAEARARQVLADAPAQPHALTLLVSAVRLQSDASNARAALEQMAKEQPTLAAVHYELGMLLAELGDTKAAIASLSRVVELEPEHPAAWRVLAEQLALDGKIDDAIKAYARHFKSSIVEVLMLERVMALGPDQLQVAATMLREFLNIYPSNVSALHLLGQLCMRADQFDEAELVLAKALRIAPEFVAARRDYGVCLNRQSKWTEENQNLDRLLETDPENAGYRYLKASVLYRLGRFADSIAYCERLLSESPTNIDYWTAYAHALSATGRSDDSIAAFRKAIQYQPGQGDAWWGLANLKTFRFSAAEIATMKAQLARNDLRQQEQPALYFALGKALEDREDYAESFDHYRSGNAIIAARNRFDREEIIHMVDRLKGRYTSAFFRDIAGKGCAAPDPIFIVSLPRSGSTLIEQILSSHSAVEALGEINALPPIVRHLEAKYGARNDKNETVMSPLEGEDLRLLGEQYLANARGRRSLSRPFFTDKMPNNWLQIGLIAAILPNAKIIDVRRHPLACGFSNFKQLFSSTIGPLYDLGEIGNYYRLYLEFMAHYDTVLPGRVHHVIYEELVREPETGIRRLLAHCNLPFEANCLRFYENTRPVATASSEQVRRPMYTDSLEQWRHYEPWLGPLKEGLGTAIADYRKTAKVPAGERA